MALACGNSPSTPPKGLSPVGLLQCRRGAVLSSKSQTKTIKELLCRVGLSGRVRRGLDGLATPNVAARGLTA
jgi:hypothetical protein